MKYCRKMKLVDVDNILDNIHTSNNNESKNRNISKLDSKINKILNLSNISCDKKAKLYDIELQRYLFFAKQNRQPKQFKVLMEKQHNNKNGKKSKSNEFNLEDEEEVNNNTQSESDGDINNNLEHSYESDDYEIQQPHMSTPYKDYSHSKINSSNPFLSAQEAKLLDESVTNGHVNISPIKYQSGNDTNPFKSKSKLDRSVILTRKIVNNSVSAANKLKNWLSLSKQKK